MNMSTATIDRKLAPQWKKMLPRSRSHTKLGSMLSGSVYRFGALSPQLRTSAPDAEISRLDLMRTTGT